MKEIGRGAGSRKQITSSGRFQATVIFTVVLLAPSPRSLDPTSALFPLFLSFLAEFQPASIARTNVSGSSLKFSFPNATTAAIGGAVFYYYDASPDRRQVVWKRRV